MDCQEAQFRAIATLEGAERRPLTFGWRVALAVITCPQQWKRWPAVCSCQVPGGGGRLRGLSLDLRLLVELLPQGCLHLSRDVWRRLADLHGRLLELDRVPAVHLRFQWVLLLHLAHFAACGRQGVGRERFGVTHAEAIFHVS